MAALADLNAPSVAAAINSAIPMLTIFLRMQSTLFNGLSE
jgi:ABC-type maltose transport system permease subunit